MVTLKGRRALVTGTGGIGWATALEIARAGGQVILAGRNPSKGAEAVSRIRHHSPGAQVEFELVDLASLESVAQLGSRLRNSLDRLDLLVNNAAVMRLPQRQTSSNGFELQFATNYLGHFALTAHLLPLLSHARVVTVSSIAARHGCLDFDDLQATRNYHPMRVYAQSKLACLMFALELERRSQAGGWGLSSLAAHPGISRTSLIYNGSGRWSFHGLLRSLLWFLFQPAAQGALPSLFAATSPEAKGGGYYGPAGFMETRGTPAEATLPRAALDRSAASRLWDVSRTLTGLEFSQ